MFRRHVNKKLSAYLHGELQPEEASRVSEHLLGCRRCRAEHDEIKFGAQMAGMLARERAPESLWSELEAAVSHEAFSHRRGTGNAEAAQRKSGFTWTPLKVGLACAPILLLIAFGFIYLNRQSPPDTKENLPSWEVTRLEGKPVIGKRKIDEKGLLPLGEWLVTDDSSRAQISVGQIGEVKIEPNSRVRLLDVRDDNHRLSLQRGKMEAFIWAPPRQFFVDTPSAVAVDLGCSYTLEVGEDGQGFLHVTLGWVAFEWQGRESFVPADAMCVTRPGFGPGTPYFSDAAVELKNALAAFDTAGDTAGTDEAARTSSLVTVLTAARKRDALTLWHLLARTAGEDRSRVYDRLAELIPPPRQTTREGVIGGDRAMLDAWWDRLELGDTEWWRLWKGPLPTGSK